MKAPNAVGKFLKNHQFTHQNNGRRSLNQNHSKHKHNVLHEKPKWEKPRKEKGELYYKNGDYRWVYLVC